MRRRDPFEVLGIASDSDEGRVRSAFRAKARELHPDRHLADPGANDRFKEIVLAYEEAIEIVRGVVPFHRFRARGRARADAPPPPPPPAPWRCASCGDRFTFRAPCPRCGVELRRTAVRSGADDVTGAAPIDLADLDAAIASFVRRDPLAALDGVLPRAELRAPAAAVALIVLGALLATQMPAPIGLALVVYGLAILAVAAHDRRASPFAS